MKTQKDNERKGEPDCMCRIHRRDRPERGPCLCHDEKCSCYEETHQKKKIRKLYRARDTHPDGTWFDVKVTSNLQPPWREPKDWPDGHMDKIIKVADELVGLVREQYTKEK